jgi:hypothetical protein
MQMQREIIVNPRPNYYWGNLRAMNLHRPLYWTKYNEYIKNIKVVFFNQLKSGDLSIKTATIKDMETLR